MVLNYAYKNRKQPVCQLVDDRAVTLEFPNPGRTAELIRAARSEAMDEDEVF